jgi:hypothetical protein
MAEAKMAKAKLDIRKEIRRLAAEVTSERDEF